MYKFFVLVALTLLLGCKDKYEKALEEVTKTSIPVRKCELKKLAQENPEFSCGEIDHQFALEKARALGLEADRIQAAANIGKLQIDQASKNLILKGSYLQTASDYRSRFSAADPAWLHELRKEIIKTDPKAYEMIQQVEKKHEQDMKDALEEAVRLEMSAKKIQSEY